MTDEIPIFPLSSVLFPGGYLPLRIFEPRYLDMVQRCHAQGSPFGVVALTEGREVRERKGGEGFATEAFHAVGTLCHIESLSRVQPGLFYVQARGQQRFQLRQPRQLSHGLWMARAELLPDDTAVALPEDLRLASRQLQDLLASWGEKASAAELPIQPPYAWGDAGWLANRWAELLPMPSAERQRLMAMDNPLLRLELVVDRLDAIR